jgi:hypothetical protein
MRLSGNVLKLDLYLILGVSPTADVEQIRKAYRSRALRSHPDLNRKNLRDAEREMVDLNVAAWVLTDPDLRQQYDRARSPAGRERSRDWYERVCFGDTDWVVPPKPKPRVVTRELAAMLRTLRLWPGRTMLSVSEWSDGLTKNQRTALTAGCCVMAALLISYARPRSLTKLFEDEAGGQARIEAEYR